MVNDFVRGHPAESHPRSLDALRAAYFGPERTGELVVAERHGKVVAMAEWARFYDMFWSHYGGRVEWLYVRPEWRGLGIPLALMALICDRVRRAGGERLDGAGNDKTTPMYERVARATDPTTVVHLGGEAFQRVADLAGLAPREIVRRLPSPDLNNVPAAPR
jgi:GNAT superfamily N-acetyltransferase